MSLTSPEPSEGVSGSISGSGRVCHICTREFSKYTCPRCNAAYCSLACYKEHSGECTEAFYREHVNEELTQRRATPEEQAKMLEILKREHEAGNDMEPEGEQGEDEQDEKDELTEGLAELDLEHISLENLTPAQRLDFERAVVDGRLAAAIEPCRPWWEERDIIAEQQLELGAIPPLSTLVKAPSPMLLVHAADLLFAYAFTIRRHNAMWQEEPLSASEMTVQLSAVLSQGSQPHSISLVLAECLQRARAPTLFNSTEFSLGTLRDMSKICASGDAFLLALTDLHAMHEAALSFAAKPKAPRRAIIKKLWFFVVWAKEHRESAAAHIKEAVLKEGVTQEEAFKGGEIKIQVPCRMAMR